MPLFIGARRALLTPRRPTVVAGGGGIPPGVVLAGEQPASSISATTTAANTIKSVPAGTLVVLLIDDGFQTPGVGGVTDSAGNVYPDLGTQNDIIASQKTGLYGAFITHPIVAGVTTFTVNSPSASAPLISVYDVPSALAADLTGPHAGNWGSAVTPYSQSIPSLNSTQEILIIGLMAFGEIPVSVPGWTSVGASGTGFGLQLLYKNVSVSTPDNSFAGTFTSPRTWSTQYATFTTGS